MVVVPQEKREEQRVCRPPTLERGVWQDYSRAGAVSHIVLAALDRITS